MILTLLIANSQMPVLFLDMTTGHERLVFVRPDGTSASWDTTSPTPSSSLYDLTLLDRSGITLFTRWTGESFLWNPTRGTVKLVQNRALMKFVGMRYGLPISLVREHEKWHLRCWTGTVNGFTTIANAELPGVLVRRLWWPGIAASQDLPQWASIAFAPSLRTHWGVPDGKTPVVSVTGSKVLWGMRQVHDFGAGAKVVCVSGNNRFATVTAVYFENPRLRGWKREVRGTWSDVSDPLPKREVYKGVIVRLSTGKIEANFDGVSRIELCRQ